MVLIISGHQRSGTTLLRQICDAHPEMHITNEFACFADVEHTYLQAIRARLAQWQLVNGRWVYDSDHAHSPRKHRANFFFTLGYLLKLAYKYTGKLTVPVVADTLKRQFPYAKIVGDKWPQYMPLLPTFVQANQVKIVVIYRDCRDVTSSFLEKVRTEWKTRPWAPDVDTAAKIAQNWVEKIKIMEQISDQIYIIRYESLIKAPEKELAKLGIWLGVEPNGFRWPKLDSASIGKHLHGLTQEELAEIWSAAGETMIRLGYGSN
jgi:hypothetical protein